MTGLSLFFGINGAIFLAVGLRALLKPLETVAEPFALTVNDVDGMSYLRSGTGGVSVASSMLLLAAIWVQQLQLLAVILFATMLDGLLAGPMYSGVVDRSPGWVPLMSGFCEFLVLAFGMGWLTVLWKQGTRVAATQSRSCTPVQFAIHSDRGRSPGRPSESG